MTANRTRKHTAPATPFGEIVRRLRRERDSNIQKQATEIQVARSTLHAMETGRLSPTLDVFAKLVAWGNLGGQGIEEMAEAFLASVDSVEVPVSSAPVDLVATIATVVKNMVALQGKSTEAVDNPVGTGCESDHLAKPMAPTSVSG